MISTSQYSCWYILLFSCIIKKIVSMLMHPVPQRCQCVYVRGGGGLSPCTCPLGKTVRLGLVRRHCHVSKSPWQCRHSPPFHSLFPPLVSGTGEGHMTEFSAHKTGMCWTLFHSFFPFCNRSRSANIKPSPAAALLARVLSWAEPKQPIKNLECLLSSLVAGVIK